MSTTNESNGGGAPPDANANGGNAGNANGGNGSNNQRRNQTRRNNNNNNTNSVNPKHWKGDTEEIGCVLGLKSDVLDFKKPYNEYVDATMNFVIRDNKEHGKFLAAPFKFNKSPTQYYTDEKSPTPPATPADGSAVPQVKVDLYKKKLERFVVTEEKIDAACTTVFTVIEGNCSEAVKEQLRNRDDYLSKKMSGDILWILAELKEITSGLEVTTNKYSLYYESLKQFVSLHQWESECDESFNNRFKDSIETLKAHGGTHVLCSPQIFGSTTMSKDDIEKETEMFKAVVYVKKLNRSAKKYGALDEMLQKEDVLGRDAYPKSMADAHNMMVTYKSKKVTGVNKNRNGNPRNDQRHQGANNRHQFAQSGEAPVAGTNGQTYPQTRCYACQKYGHISTYCPTTNTGVNMTQIGFSMTQNDGTPRTISKWWVLLDTCSSATTVCNEKLVKNLRDATMDEKILLHSDAGSQLYDRIGELKDFPLSAMFNPNGIANVLSLKDVADIPGTSITMNTSVDPGIKVRFKNGTEFVFNRSKDGLHFFDLAPLYNSMSNIKGGVTNYSVSCNQTSSNVSNPPTLIPNDDDSSDDDSLSTRSNQGATDTSSHSNNNNNNNQGAHQTSNNHNQGAHNQGANENQHQGANETQHQKQNHIPHILKHTHLDLVTTVQNNKKNFTKKEITQAIEARHMQQTVGWPSKSEFINIIAGNHLQNSSVTVDDVIRAEHIFGTPIPLLKGKTTKPPPSTSYNLQKVVLPLPILQHHKDLDLFVDFMYVNGIPFLHVISSKIHHRYSIMFSSREIPGVIKELRIILKTYMERGFNIRNIHGDNEFNVEEFIQKMKPCDTIIYPPNEHVKEIERSIRTMKERSRCICHSLPYTRYTKLMTKHLVKTVTTWLNSFPSNDSISKTMSPATIVEGSHKPDMTKPRIPFGSYALVYASTTNNMKSRAIEAIALSDAGPKGGHYFMNLETGKQIHGYKWTALPITNKVIEAVEDLAYDEKQPVLVPGEPTYEWTPGYPIFDNIDEDIHEDVMQDHQDLINEEEDIHYDQLDNDDDMSAVIAITDDNTSSDDDETETEDEDLYNDNDNENTTNENRNMSYDTETDDDVFSNNDNNNEENDETLHDDSITVEDVDEDDDESDYNTDYSNDEGNIPSTNGENEVPETNERPRRENAGTGVQRLEMSFGGKTYADLKTQFTQVKERACSKRWSNRKRFRHAVQLLRRARAEGNNAEFHEKMNIALHVMFTQMTAKRGIKLFGEEAIAAIYKEYKQLDEGAKKGNPVVTPTPWESLTEEDKRQALDAVNLIKQKRCGKIKGRCAANGSRQRQYLKPDESVASPTVSLEGLLATFMIDAKEGRQVNTFDVPGAFLQAPMPKDKKVLLKMKGEFVDIMCRVNPEHLPNVRYEGKEKVLYLKVDRAIYGCIESSLMWYNMFTGILVDMGFTLNDYDKCVATKMINGKMCTIVWYVDDVKISHMDQCVLDVINDKMQEHFGPMEIVKGDEHSYLGMNITINRKKKAIEIEMKQQLLEAIEAFKGEVNEEVVSPAAKHIFDTRDGEVPKLCKERAENFHHVTAKLLHLMKRARPDIEIPIVFLCTRVKSPDEDDWKKLQRVLCWIKSTIDETRFIGADDLKKLYTWVDASYAVHPNMRSQTGGTMSMGTGIIHCKSSRQKLNTKSSTEAELVGVSDYLPYNIWLMHFMKDLGYEIEVNVLYQDNQSAMKMEKNGRNSCTGNSRHINIRYFWVKDKIEKGEIDLKYCPTEKMLADYFTKALQGSAFMRFWYVIMGHKHIDTLFESNDDIEIENSNIEEREENTTESQIRKKEEEKEENVNTEEL